MKKRGYWAGQEALYAIAMALQLKIVVHQYRTPRNIFSHDEPHREIDIFFNGTNHYKALIPSNNTVEPSPPAKRTKRTKTN